VTWRNLAIILAKRNPAIVGRRVIDVPITDPRDHFSTSKSLNKEDIWHYG
jgi:hypothetical protein